MMIMMMAAKARQRNTRQNVDQLYKSAYNVTSVRTAAHTKNPP